MRRAEYAIVLAFRQLVVAMLVPSSMGVIYCTKSISKHGWGTLSSVPGKGQACCFIGDAWLVLAKQNYVAHITVFSVEVLIVAHTNHSNLPFPPLSIQPELNEKGCNCAFSLSLNFTHCKKQQPPLQSRTMCENHAAFFIVHDCDQP